MECLSHSCIPMALHGVWLITFTYLLNLLKSARVPGAAFLVVETTSVQWLTSRPRPETHRARAGVGLHPMAMNH